MIRVVWVLCLILFSSMQAEENTTAAAEASRSILHTELQKAIELEKKYAKEQKFYDAKTYDFKGAEVNKNSLANVPLIEPDDPELDSDAILGMSEEEGLSW